MSYLSELNQLVARKTADAAKLATSQDIYAALLRELAKNCVWVRHDSYTEISGVCVVSDSAGASVDPIVARVDLHPRPIVSTRSTKLFALVSELCLNKGGVFLERKTITADLQLRQSKLVLFASLRNYDHMLTERFAPQIVEDMRAQQRCVIFPLEALASKAGLHLSDVIPDKTLFQP